MDTIIFPSEVQAQLAGLTEPVAVTDLSGKPLGHYVPGDHLLYLIAEAQSPLSQEERRKRREQKGGRPLADILRDLNAQ